MNLFKLSGVSKDKIMGLGVVDSSRNHTNEHFFVFWKVEIQSYYFPMKLNDSTEPLAFPKIDNLN